MPRDLRRLKIGYREEIERVESDRFDALRSGDASRLQPLYEADARNLAPHEPMRVGIDAVIAYWQREIDRGVRDGFDETIMAEEHGGLGFELGTYVFRFTAPDGSGSWEERGKHVTVYHRQPDGTIRVVAECLALDDPPSP